jgi:hypothetical protein
MFEKGKNMEIESTRLPTNLNPLENIKNLPKWMKPLKVGDTLTYTDSKTLRKVGAPEEIVTRIEAFKASGKKLLLTDKMVKYLEMKDGLFYGVLNMSGDETIQCSVDWLEPIIHEEKNPFIPWSIAGSKPTDHDLEEMKSHVDMERLSAVLKYSNQGKPIHADVAKSYLNAWALAKWDLYCMLGKRLSISRPIEFEVDDKEMASFQLELMRKFPKYAAVLDQFPIKCYTQNTTTNYNNTGWMDKAGVTQPQSGMKLSKFLSTLFDDGIFDIELSKCLQNRMVKGQFYVSIDPYDFLTMSTNKHGWTSCLDVTKATEGGNASGTFSYFVDSTSMVCFRSNDKDYEYGLKNVSFAGNSKSWRQLVHVSKETSALMFNRQYPQNSNLEAAKLVRELLETRISDYLGKPNTWENLGSNDSYYKPQVTIAYNDRQANTRIVAVPKDTPLSFTIDSGGKVFCLNCNKLGTTPNCCNGR